jgi:hypothetical protein
VVTAGHNQQTIRPSNEEAIHTDVAFGTLYGGNIRHPQLCCQLLCYAAADVLPTALLCCCKRVQAWGSAAAGLATLTAADRKM